MNLAEREQSFISMATLKAIDFFCGAGGSSWGARAAGIEIVAGIDSSTDAIASFQRNFPNARTWTSRLEELNPVEVKRLCGKIDLILASPECTNHSPAKGNKPRCEVSKATAFQVIRFASVLQPRWIVIENVTGMRRWSRYAEFIDALSRLRYHVTQQVLNAVDFGVPQRRRRLFILCDRRHLPAPTLPCLTKCPNARSIVNLNGNYAYTPLQSPRRARATLERAALAMSEVGSARPFLLVYYGSDAAGGWQKLEMPLRTITTLDRFAVVKPSRAGHLMRMLQVPELKRAMGMPLGFATGNGSRRSQIRAIGNAVCPPVMRAVVRQLTCEKRIRGDAQ